MEKLQDLINKLVEVDSRITFESTKGQFDKTKQRERNEIRNKIEVICGQYDKMLERLIKTNSELDKQKIWGGMEWKYHPIPPILYRRIHRKNDELITECLEDK